MNWNRFPHRPSMELLLFGSLGMLIALAVGSFLPLSDEPVNAEEPVNAQLAYGKSPLYFEANRGQIDQQVKFLSRGSHHTLFLTLTEAVLVMTKAEQLARKPDLSEKFTQTALRMTFLGANPQPRMIGQDELVGKANYFLGNDPTRWQTNVPTYGKVYYQDLYPGINLIYYYGNQRQLEYDLSIRPGVDPQVILLRYEGAEILELDDEGNLVLLTADGAIRQLKPFIYQEIDGVRRQVSGGYVLKDNHQVGFHVGAYDRSSPLVIDPTLVYSTYVGGSGEDVAQGIAVDGAGNAYVTGFTQSADYPTTPGAYQTALGGTANAFVTTINPTGSGLVYSTYLGGSAFDEGVAIAIDEAGNAYVTGWTQSANFPTTPGAFQSAKGAASQKPFAAKINPTGTALLYSTYLGGSGADQGFGIAVDGGGNAYITGQTNSSDFPTTVGAFQTVYGGGVDAFVTKVNPLGTGLVYSTYLGGSGLDEGTAIAIDGATNAYVTGLTFSLDFPTTLGAFQTANGGSDDAFVTKLNPTGTGLNYSTYLGGSGSEIGHGIGLDSVSTPNAYVTGETSSLNFPTTPGSFQTAFGGTRDAFVTKVNPTGSALVYSTYLGAIGDETGESITVDTSGNAYVAGVTNSSNFPTTPGAFQTVFGGIRDAFVTTMNPFGAALVFSTYLGGSGDDVGRGISADTLATPNAYVTGHTNSLNFPTTPGAFQTTFAGGSYDVFVAEIAVPFGPPTNKDQCKNEGWMRFNVPEKFKNQGDCIQFVNTSK